MSEGSPVWECYRLPGISNPDEWRAVLEQCLEKEECPYHYDIRNTSLRVWDPAEQAIKAPGSDYTCRNGYEIQRVAFGGTKEETLVGISLTRLVFGPNSEFPTFFSTDELFSQGKYPEILRHQPMIGGITRLIDFLNRSLTGRRLERHKRYTVAHHAKNVIYRFGASSYSLNQIVQNPGLSKNLLNAVRSGKAAVPASVRLGVLSSGVRDSAKALEIGSKVVEVLQDWSCGASLEDLKRGAGIEAFLADFSAGQPVVLIPLQGKKGDRPHDSAIEWLKYLDSEKAAFQLCSISSNPLYTRHGLAIAILAKANGAIFVTEPSGFPNFHRSWYVGLDLGRGGLNKGRIVVITLTNSEGNLLAYWRATKGEDETLSPAILREGLLWIADKAESLVAGRHIYLIRDGRRPRNESLDSYHDTLPNQNFTLIEYVKSGSPLIHRASFEPEPGTAIIPEESAFTALYPCTSPQRGVLTTPVKFHTPINPNGHSSSDIALLLTALCHSATLSYQPSRLPAPLQWANGLARISYTDLQFSGWSHRDTRRLNLAAP